jgi:hypothetical protein
VQKSGLQFYSSDIRHLTTVFILADIAPLSIEDFSLRINSSASPVIRLDLPFCISFLISPEHPSLIHRNESVRQNNMSSPVQIACCCRFCLP